MNNIGKKIVNRIKWLKKKIIKIHCRCLGFVFIEPDYFLKVSLLPKGQAIVVDCGTGDIPDFSVNLMQRFGFKCYGFEPTRKHHKSLETFVTKFNGLFEYHGFAISDKSETRIFHESLEHVCGSLLQNHRRVITDTINSYEVMTISIESLFEYLGISHIDILKMDIEGEEYQVLNNIRAETLEKISQIAVEYHDFCIDGYTQVDTQRAVDRLTSFGFKYLTYDKQNYLFYR